MWDVKLCARDSEFSSTESRAHNLISHATLCSLLGLRMSAIGRVINTHLHQVYLSSTNCSLCFGIFIPSIETCRGTSQFSVSKGLFSCPYSKFHKYYPRLKKNVYCQISHLPEANLLSGRDISVNRYRMEERNETIEHALDKVSIPFSFT